MRYLFVLILAGFLCAHASSSSYSSESSSSSDSSSSDSSSNESSSSESKEDSKDKYSYTLWIGDDVEKQYSINFKCKPGTTFIEAMDKAADKDKHFRYKKTSHPTYGAFITQICGVANDKPSNQFWMLYDLPSRPDIENKPCDKWLTSDGASSTVVMERHYLFWFKTVTLANVCDA